MEFTPKRWVVVVATIIWWLAALSCAFVIFDSDLTLPAQVIIGAAALFSFYMATIAPAKVRCSALMIRGPLN